MKKSKHFRKDVILARVIAGVLLLVVIAFLVFAISLLTKNGGDDKNSQNTSNTEQTEQTENTESLLPENQDTEDVEDTESDVVIETESESVDVEKVYVKTTTQVRLRQEPNTSCTVLDRIDGNTTLEVVEKLNGWYKVIYNGQEGYVSATYAKIVEE